MRILSILILTWVVAHLDQVSGKRRLQKGPKNKGPCGKPYLQQVNGKCYYVSTKKINWFGAQNNCLRKDLNLADVATPEDFKAVTDYLKSQYGKEDYWIGGNDLQKEGKFSYISNGEPMNYMGEDIMVEPTVRSNVDDCLELRIRTNTTTIMDVNCRDKKYFVCENSQLKCVEPTADENGNNHHSHEHLHHFHHDAGEKEQQGAGKADMEADESESRPLDNSNSTEIGTSDEKGLTEAGNDTTTAVDTASEGVTTEAAAPTEEAKPTGEETKPTGEEAKPTGEETKPTGEEATPTGEEATAKEEAKPAEEATAVEEAKPKEEATAAAEAPVARTAPLPERN
ncbi:enolase-phosphatase E1 [Drosophila kikkawai]|uniref:Enolase-phosphatase E1 n=1 Tax=Drosophila kikkawai TaxID=30033 RepID=A0A6P4IH14_DROKI|nr:golgin subfamily A member 6-like protein 2 [Drosophila kikkawai]